MLQLLRLMNWIESSGLAGVVVPSTDEFLSEFAPPCNRRLKWVTGFRGSTGVAVVLRKRAALFVDGRYLLQASGDVESSLIDVKPAKLDCRRTWLADNLVKYDQIGFDPWVHSIADMMQWRDLVSSAGAATELLAKSPIDDLWSEDRPAPYRPRIVDYSTIYAGDDYKTKCAAVAKYLRTAGLQSLVVADPEDVSWLLNVRAEDKASRMQVGDWHVVPSCPTRALVHQNGEVAWFVNPDDIDDMVLSRGDGPVSILPPSNMLDELEDAKTRGRIGADLRRTPAALTAFVEAGNLACSQDVVARGRWRKHAVEGQSAAKAHIIDAVAVVRFIDWLKRTISQQRVLELDAAAALEGFRSEHSGYKGASMAFMSASGPSASQPHYVPSNGRNRCLNDHPVFWMDSGGQYEGCSTDNTITLAVGSPEQKHVRAHTLVLRSLIALATIRFPKGTYALHLDPIARQPLWREGMDYDHATGHGVGNYLNIHEGPLIGREPSPVTTTVLEPGMIVTNEPGYYAANDFGIRIESHMVVVQSAYEDFLEFRTISRLPVDPELIDFALLSADERRWLAAYHQTVLADLQSRLDPSSAILLKKWTTIFCDAGE